MFGSQIIPLKKLFIHKNSIANVQPRTFAMLPNVDFLSLAHNQIKSLDDGIFESLGKLKKLHLHHNQLESISQKILEDISRVSEFQIKHNRLTFLPNSLQNFNNLENVSIEGNPWQCACFREIFDYITKLAQLRRIDYHSKNNSYYSGVKPLCYELPIDPPSCIRNIDLVRQYRVVEMYENAVRP